MIREKLIKEDDGIFFIENIKHFFIQLLKIYRNINLRILRHNLELSFHVPQYPTLSDCVGKG